MRKNAVLVLAVLGVIGSSSVALADTTMEMQTYFMPEQQSVVDAGSIVYSDQTASYADAQGVYGTDIAMGSDSLGIATDAVAYADPMGGVEYVTEEVQYADMPLEAVDYGMQEAQYTDMPAEGNGDYVSVDIAAYEVMAAPEGTVVDYSQTTTATY